MKPFSRALPLSALALLALADCSGLQRSDQATNTEDALPSASARPALDLPAPAPQAPSAPATAATDAAAAGPSAAAAPETGNTAAPRADSDAQPIGDPLAATTLAPQTIDAHARKSPPGANPKLAEAAALYAAAQKEQDDAAFMKAASMWKDFLDREPGMPGYERASYNYGFCLFSLGHPAEASEHLRTLISSAADARLVNDARILLAESLIQTGKPEEALASTFDVLPSEHREAQFGFKRDAGAAGTSQSTTPPSLTQKIRLYTIRGRIYAALKVDDHAHAALEKAKQLLLGAGKGKISRKDMRTLSATYGWRQIEVQGLICSHEVPVPERLSEAEFLAYADAYYGCAEPARHLYCTVLAAGDEQVKARALAAYRDVVEAPLAIREHLPPPARAIKKPGTVGQYESDMRSLIEKTVAEHAKEYRDIPACHAHDIF